MESVPLELAGMVLAASVSRDILEVTVRLFVHARMEFALTV